MTDDKDISAEEFVNNLLEIPKEVTLTGEQLTNLLVSAGVIPQEFSNYDTQDIDGEVVAIHTDYGGNTNIININNITIQIKWKQSKVEG